MEDKQAAKKLIKRAKKHPDWYNVEDVRFAKMVKKRIKAEEKAQKGQQNVVSEATQHDGRLRYSEKLAHITY